MPAKRKLKDISFEKEGAHIALVSKEQGGPANGADYALIMKATKQFSEEFVQKMQQVQVTMELPEFLEKFFHLYGSDAQVLARMMGYVKPEEESDDEEESYEDWYEKRIEERLASFTILKSMKDSSLGDVITKLDEDQYLQLLKDQQSLEKAFSDIEKNLADKAKEGSTEAVVKAKESDETKVEPSETLIKGKDKMEEMELLQKSLADTTVELNKAKEEIAKANEALAAFRAEKQAALLKARKEKLSAAVKDEAKTEILFKALSGLEDEAEFEAVVKTLGELTAVVEGSDLFVEKGAQVEGDVKPEESPVAKIIKAKHGLK